MLIVGIILTVLGGISLIYGLIQLLGETSAIINFANQLGAGITNPGLVWLIIGIVVAIIGVILMIVGNKKKKSNI